MQLPAVLGILGLAVSTAAKITFINPPQFTRKVQVTEHDVWVTGQTIDIRWSQPDEGKKLSVVLYQMNSTMAASFNGQFPGADPPFEYITHDQVGATFFRWIVGTTKDLRFSNQFAIAVWAEGTVVTDSATNIFNITSAATLPDDTSSTTAGSGPAQTSPGDLSPTPGSGSSSGGLSAGAAAGVGIGAAIAVIALAAGIWYFIWRRKREEPPVLVSEFGGMETRPPSGNGPGGLEKVTYYQSQTSNYTPSPVHSNELGVQTRAEMPPAGTRHEMS